MLRKIASFALICLIIIIAIIFVNYFNNNSVDLGKNKIDQQSINSQINPVSTDTELNSVTEKDKENISTTQPLYTKSQKEAEIKKIEEELSLDPENELLKGKKDLLLKEWINSGDFDIFKE